MQNAATAHIYANGRRFLIVPVIVDAEGKSVELDAVQDVPLTLGRPTVVRLSRALRTARDLSQRAEADQPHWDGEDGRWWSHRLLGLRAHWDAGRVTLTDLRESTLDPTLFPEDATDSDVAETLIDLLGQKLHAT